MPAMESISSLVRIRGIAAFYLHWQMPCGCQVLIWSTRMQNPSWSIWMQSLSWGTRMQSPSWGMWMQSPSRVRSGPANRSAGQPASQPASLVYVHVHAGICVCAVAIFALAQLDPGPGCGGRCHLLSGISWGIGHCFGVALLPIDDFAW